MSLQDKSSVRSTQLSATAAHKRCIPDGFDPKRFPARLNEAMLVLVLMALDNNVHSASLCVAEL
eukprot:m.1143824 g.1143824  ORF g.1143824 m.1143824 type:complete len:64 (-) comp24459_c0_seq25:198-389(-)